MGIVSIVSIVITCYKKFIKTEKSKNSNLDITFFENGVQSLLTTALEATLIVVIFFNVLDCILEQGILVTVNHQEN